MSMSGVWMRKTVARRAIRVLLGRRNTSIVCSVVAIAVVAIMFANQNTGSGVLDTNGALPGTCGLGGQCQTTTGGQVVDQLSVVKRVIDGDTIELDSGERVRYIGIDAPEVSGKAECYADDATALNISLVAGRLVRLVPDEKDRDQYGRLLRYVYVDDVFINQELVRAGAARATDYPPNSAHKFDFEREQATARSNRLGVWSCSRS